MTRKNQFKAIGAIEYRFSDIKSSLSNKIIPRMFLELSQTNPTEWMKRFYYNPPNLEHLSPLQSITAVVQQFTPTSLVLACDQNWYVRCCLGKPENTSGNIYLAPRLHYDIVRSLVEGIGLKTGTQFDLFVQTFGGLRESLPPDSGNFLYDEFTLFGDHPAAQDFDLSEEYEDWEDSLCLYYSRNGDVLLFSADGETGWFSQSDQTIRVYSKTFNAFMAKYASFLREYSDSFDASHAESPRTRRPKRLRGSSKKRR